MIHTFGPGWTGFRKMMPLALLAGLIVPSLSGCAVFLKGLDALNVAQVYPPKYKNLAGQSVAVYVWAEGNGLRIEWPRIQLDMGQAVQAKLIKMQEQDKPEELKLTRFPVSAGSVARFQEEHPELAALTMEEVAPKLGVSRVIYIELRDFHTRSELVNDLFRGYASGSVSVVEVTNGKGHKVVVDEEIRVTYPRTSREEGLPNIGDDTTANGTLDGFATEVAKRFLPHAEDPDADYGVVAAPK